MHPETIKIEKEIKTHTSLRSESKTSGAETIVGRSIPRGPRTSETLGRSVGRSMSKAVKTTRYSTSVKIYRDFHDVNRGGFIGARIKSGAYETRASGNHLLIFYARSYLLLLFRPSRRVKPSF